MYMYVYIGPYCINKHYVHTSLLLVSGFVIACSPPLNMVYVLRFHAPRCSHFYYDQVLCHSSNLSCSSCSVMAGIGASDVSAGL